MRLPKAAALAAALTLVAVAPIAAPAIAFSAEASSAVAAAATDTVVTIPWGQWLQDSAGFLTWAVTIAAVLGVLWASQFLPAPLKAYVNATNIAAVEQLIERAADYGVKKAVLAARGQEANVDVHSQALAEAGQYAVDHGAEKVVEFAGGVDQLEQKIIARLPLPDELKKLVEAQPPAPAK